MRKLIITPMKEELDFLLQSYTKAGFHAESAKIGRLPVVRIPDLGVTLARVDWARFSLLSKHSTYWIPAAIGIWLFVQGQLVH